MDSESCIECGLSFPLQVEPGICHKCKRLEAVDRDSVLYNKMIDWLQCLMCGACHRNMKRVPNRSIQTCGLERCLALTSQDNGNDQQLSKDVSHGLTPVQQIINRDIAETHQARAALLLQRLKRNGVIPTQPLSNLSTTALQHREQSSNASGQLYGCIAWNCRRSDKPKAIDHIFGSGIRNFPLADSMTDITTVILEAVNKDWSRNYSTLLELSDVSIRFHGNRTLHSDTETLTFEDFYAHYSSPDNIQVFVLDVPLTWKSALRDKKGGPFLCLEVFIRIDSWKLRAELSGESILGSRRTASSSKRKRSHNTNESDEDVSGGCGPRSSAVISKQARAGGGSVTVRSQFRLSSRTIFSKVHSATLVKFKKILCVVSTDTGEPSFQSVDGALGEVQGQLHNEPFTHGSMKSVYNLSINEKGTFVQYVAKRFFRLQETDPEDWSAAQATLDVESHNTYIQAECGRLHTGRWFMNAFQKVCNKENVAIDQAIIFEDAFLLEEIGSDPSPASGLNSGLMWLIERKRSTTVQRFSGTLVHPSHAVDLRHSTIYAFAHFVYGWSHQAMVFADLQGTPHNVSGMDGLVLFDPMTHTSNSASGIGDHGLQEIQSFVDDHSCGPLCNMLHLSENMPLLPTDPDDDEAEQSD